MHTVYLVTVGEYDYEYVWGAYSSRELAEQERRHAENSAEPNQVAEDGRRWLETTCVYTLKVDAPGPLPIGDAEHFCPMIAG